MNRLLVLGQIVSFVLIGTLAFLIVSGASAPGSHSFFLGPVGPGSEDLSADELSAEGELRDRCAVLEERLAQLIAENEELTLRTEELELDALSANAAIDDIQGMALQHSIRWRQIEAKAAAVAGNAYESSESALPFVADVDAGFVQSFEDGTVAVAPAVDQAVRIVLANMDEERRQERQQRQIQRELKLFDRLGERFELSGGQVMVVQDAFVQRRQEFRKIRELTNAGHLDKKLARERGRAAQNRYRSEVAAVVGDDRYQQVQRFLNRSEGRDGKKDAPRKKQAGK